MINAKEARSKAEEVNYPAELMKDIESKIIQAAANGEYSCVGFCVGPHGEMAPDHEFALGALQDVGFGAEITVVDPRTKGRDVIIRW